MSKYRVPNVDVPNLASKLPEPARKPAGFIGSLIADLTGMNDPAAQVLGAGNVLEAPNAALVKALMPLTRGSLAEGQRLAPEVLADLKPPSNRPKYGIRTREPNADMLREFVRWLTEDAPKNLEQSAKNPDIVATTSRVTNMRPPAQSFKNPETLMPQHGNGQPVRQMPLPESVSLPPKFPAPARDPLVAVMAERYKTFDSNQNPITQAMRNSQLPRSSFSKEPPPLSGVWGKRSNRTTKTAIEQRKQLNKAYTPKSK